MGKYQRSAATDASLAPVLRGLGSQVQCGISTGIGN